MSENKKQPLVPRLRFPAFFDDQSWSFQPLGRLARRSTKKNTDGDITRVLTNSAEYGVIDQRDFFDKYIANQGNLEGYYIVEEGDYVYNPRISATAPVGPISKNRIGLGVMSPLYTVFRFNNTQNDIYAHYFKSTHWHQYMRQASSTGARHDRMSITNDDFMGLPLPVSKPEEQQKIADCLSSLDDLIAAETQRLDTLKTHKKGLMQQLFPREGETVPGLRFPEFREAGEWKETLFGKLVVKSFYGTSSSTSNTGKYPVLRMGNMVDGALSFSNLAYIDLDEKSFAKIRLAPGDILLNRTNSPDLVGKVSIFDQDIECITASYIVTYRLDRAQVVPEFCNLILNTPRCQRKIRALARPSISQANINPTAFKNELTVALPNIEEQRQIVSCFSDIDERISSQIKKIELLKVQKAGLMQQLFPVPDGAVA
ncbi:restriction endonuclease subunit S [Comamonas kerstersii]|uniref:restriction endonuclease subunit S n=1 Tax=Comamonas kerstersii TaxID=225992 RepID=UPI00266B8FF0|nr:restriction endonuclease subunit S [Comamonas kerstersii]